MLKFELFIFLNQIKKIKNVEVPVSTRFVQSNIYAMKKKTSFKYLYLRN